MNVNTNPSAFAAQNAIDSLQSTSTARIEQLGQSGQQLEAAEEFESLFASMLVKEMRQTVDGGFFGKGPGADTYGQWFDTEMGKALAEDGGLGLADVLRVQLGIEQAAKAAEAKQSGALDLAPEPLAVRPNTEATDRAIQPTPELPIPSDDQGIVISPDAQL